ncbi:hypothetical protein DFJ58DRAFT_477597 [Suillus subalutaceus]|uniref:uncharacterized protein n=1 Tax=Suillus subalutaceus TaxID=48586 RepID=UPI001B86B062|nr:uncharacterized protein DFJ58DRAFT_477597 [Suillus subalutaceus]KAG1847854.1 hypothetical protein DFJ58DRAFT_477597 [Suillus subalutaceus]
MRHRHFRDTLPWCRFGCDAFEGTHPILALRPAFLAICRAHNRQPYDETSPLLDDKLLTISGRFSTVVTLEPNILFIRLPIGNWKLVVPLQNVRVVDHITHIIMQALHRRYGSIKMTVCLTIHKAISFNSSLGTRLSEPGKFCIVTVAITRAGSASA